MSRRVWRFRPAQIAAAPSTEDGMSSEEELRMRSEGVSHIRDIGLRLRLPNTLTATAAVFFHRFFMFQSFRVFDHATTAIACLLVAVKTADLPLPDGRRIKKRDLVLASNYALQCHLEKKKRVHKMPDNDLEALEHEVDIYERILLPTVGFDLNVTTPYSYLPVMAAHKQVQMYTARTLNTIMGGTLVLTHCPLLVALASMQYAIDKIKDAKVENKQDAEQPWWMAARDSLNGDFSEADFQEVVGLVSRQVEIEQAYGKESRVVVAGNGSADAARKRPRIATTNGTTS
eukprot:m.109059 g.109059  ORF g.109059 m.109059 type:complete len:288 (+) comp9287_c0_seq2:138-1001(+)